jgi:hypothetical protein
MSDAFIAYKPQLEDYWRGIILFGGNVASYKFALSKALLELRPAAGQLVRLDELAVPFASHICEHLKLADKQGTSASSRFLDACRKANSGEITKAQLTKQTVRFAFNNVIDAFHVVGRAAVPKRFFIDERTGSAGGIRITDEFSALLAGEQAPNLGGEAESRWRLVETAWELAVPRALLTIDFDPITEGLFAVDSARKRQAVTGSRGALNGYQKGKCFYCFANITLDGPASPDVDHFFPHSLKAIGVGRMIDGVWNLVLACRECNRGLRGKWDRVPSIRLLERLSRRNEFLIGSHHPLRETLIAQTGVTPFDRRAFLNDFHRRAVTSILHQWDSIEVADSLF